MQPELNRRLSIQPLALDLAWYRIQNGRRSLLAPTTTGFTTNITARATVFVSPQLFRFRIRARRSEKRVEQLKNWSGRAFCWLPRLPTAVIEKRFNIPRFGHRTPR